ncbi:MAG: hypothetical protein KIT72_04240 [Polyangiaceae bacterium]|nr:hypothetical protein [Polyangiaceae bacterium]MCW5789613.1 hypothetical protein [Polyangiaceae bacterium]
MSAHDPHAADAHDHDEDELDPDEPHTPGWLSLLGVGLFVGVGILAVALDSGEAPAAPPPAAAVAPPAPPPADEAAPQGAAGEAPAVVPPGLDPARAQEAARRVMERLQQIAPPPAEP